MRACKPSSLDASSSLPNLGKVVDVCGVLSLAVLDRFAVSRVSASIACCSAAAIVAESASSCLSEASVCRGSAAKYGESGVQAWLIAAGMRQASPMPFVRSLPEVGYARTDRGFDVTVHFQAAWDTCERCSFCQYFYELSCDAATTLYAMALQPTKRGHRREDGVRGHLWHKVFVLGVLTSGNIRLGYAFGASSLVRAGVLVCCIAARRLDMSCLCLGRLGSVGAWAQYPSLLLLMSKP